MPRQRNLPPTMMPSLSHTASHSSIECVVKMTLRDAEREEITSHIDLVCGRVVGGPASGDLSGTSRAQWLNIGGNGAEIADAVGTVPKENVDTFKY